MGPSIAGPEPLVTGLAEIEQSLDVSREFLVRVSAHAGFGITDEDHRERIFGPGAARRSPECGSCRSAPDERWSTR